MASSMFIFENSTYFNVKWKIRRSINMYTFFYLPLFTTKKWHKKHYVYFYYFYLVAFEMIIGVSPVYNT